MPAPGPLAASVRVPGSKSITNRALVLAALSTPFSCTLQGALQSEDTEVMVACLQRLGIEVRTCWSDSRVEVVSSPERGIIPVSNADLYVANSGTTMRFLTAFVCLGRGRYRLDGISRMRERPIQDLLSALQQWGADAQCEAGNGCPPVLIQAQGLKGAGLKVRGEVSSQFLSALLMAAARASGDITISVDGGLVSEPYVVMTVAMMRHWGIEVDCSGGVFRIPGRQQPRCDEYAIEPDASAASYFAGAAAITGGDVTLEGLVRPGLQGDVEFLAILERMGCTLQRVEKGLRVQGGRLRGLDVDMNAISDCAMTLAAVACFAEGPTTIRNVAHIRHKETDRLHALTVELGKIGVGVQEFADGLTIVPGRLRGAIIDTYQDHRMAMSLALVGLRVPGIVIRDPHCVIKTYPNFFADLERCSRAVPV